MDIDKIRAGLKGLEDGIFLNSAGSSIPPLSVNRIIKEYLDKESLLGGYALQFDSETQFASFYSEIARLMHCAPRNIAFASSATDAYGKALSSIKFKAGDVILTSDDDYVSNYYQFINLIAREGIEVKRMALLENGDLDLASIEQQMHDYRPKLVALAHIPTNSGLVQDAEAIGTLCKTLDSIYLVDACQSVGQMAVDVNKLKCDFLSVTGRKFMRGPRGTGFLYVSDRMLATNAHPMIMDGGAAVWKEALSYDLEASAKRYELWEKPYALLLGLTEAVRYANTLGMSAIELYNKELMSNLRSNLTAIKGVSLYDRGSHLCNILTFRKEGRSLEETKAYLDRHKISCSIGMRHHAVIDYDKKGLDWVVRLSPHYFNTKHEMNRLAELIEEM